MHINELSSELLVMIFSKIGDFTEKTRLEHVCSHWRYQIVPLHWMTTKTCSKPLNHRKILSLVLNRCGEWLEELWLQNVEINEKLVKQMAMQMKCLKHLKLSKCKLDGPAANSIADLFGHKLYSFFLDETEYHPNLQRLIENESSKLEHLQICVGRYPTPTRTILPTKLPTNLKSFSLFAWYEFYGYSSNLLSTVAKNCKNLKILHLEIHTLRRDVIMIIRNIKSLVYLNLAVMSIVNEDALKNVIFCELPNLKALRIGHCKEETVSNICQNRPDLQYLNVFIQTRHAFQIPDSLNSLTLRISMNFGQFFPELLFQQPNKSIQHLDIRSQVLPFSSNFIEKLLGQFKDLKSLHCRMPATDTELNSFLSLIEDHLENGRKITIYLHFGTYYGIGARYNKYILPDDFLQFKAGWMPKECNEKCENLILKKIIKEAINGANEPSWCQMKELNEIYQMI